MLRHQATAIVNGLPMRMALSRVQRSSSKKSDGYRFARTIPTKPIGLASPLNGALGDRNAKAAREGRV